MKWYPVLPAIALLLAPACDDVQYDDEGLSTAEAYDELILAGAEASEILCHCYGGEDDCNRADEVRDRSCELEVFESWVDGANFLRCRGERFRGMEACATGCPDFEKYQECVVPHDDAYRRCTGSLPPDVQRQLELCAVAEQCGADQDCGDGQLCNDGSCEPEVGTEIVYRFVLIESAVDLVAGEYPGPDIDAVGLIKANGRQHFATAVELAEIPGPEQSLGSDTNQLIGPPDTDCEDLTAMTALGPTGSYVVVSFGTAGEDVIIENGDSLRIYELGEAYCGMFDEDYVHIGVLEEPERAGDVKLQCSNCQETVVSGL